MIRAALIILSIICITALCWPVTTPKCGGSFDPFNTCEVSK